jgi:hypothetical protein
MVLHRPVEPAHVFGKFGLPTWWKLLKTPAVWKAACPRLRKRTFHLDLPEETKPEMASHPLRKNYETDSIGLDHHTL